MESDTNRRLLSTAVARTAAGDRNALQTIYRLASAKLFAVCLRILGERADAEDVLQEVFMTVWRKAASFDAGLASPMTWLIAIARNRAIDRLRARSSAGRTAPVEEAAAMRDEAPAADEALVDAEDRARLHLCLDGLAEHERTALRAAFFDGSTYEELAERMKVPLGTMKSWIRRAMFKLRGCLQQ